jgi:hypothetical protein
MKDRVDISMGIVTLIPEALEKIKPTEPLRFTKGTAHQKRNCSDSETAQVTCSPAKILASRCVYKKNRRTKSSYTRPEVLPVTGRKTMGSGLSVYS